MAIPAPTRRGQALCAAGAGQQAQLDFRLPHLGVGRHDAQVTSHAHLHAAAQRQPVDGRNGRLTQILDGAQAGVQARREFFGPPRRQQTRKFLDVETGAEGPFAGAGDYRHLHFRVAGQTAETRRKFLHHLRVQHVQRRVAQPDDRKRSFPVHGNHLPIGCHGKLQSMRCYVV